MLQVHLSKIISKQINRTLARIITSSLSSEAATGGVLQKKVFCEISQNSQENTCARVSFLIKLQAPFSQNTAGRLLLSVPKNSYKYTSHCENCN